jgi:hypothetical protein
MHWTACSVNALPVVADGQIIGHLGQAAVIAFELEGRRVGPGGHRWTCEEDPARPSVAHLHQVPIGAESS